MVYMTISAWMFESAVFSFLFIFSSFFLHNLASLVTVLGLITVPCKPMTKKKEEISRTF